MSANHDLIELLTIGRDRVKYVCECGAIGTSSRAWPGDDVEKKARTNHRQHADYYKSRSQMNKPLNIRKWNRYQWIMSELATIPNGVWFNTDDIQYVLTGNEGHLAGWYHPVMRALLDYHKDHSTELLRFPDLALNSHGHRVYYCWCPILPANY